MNAGRSRAEAMTGAVTQTPDPVFAPNSGVSSDSTGIPREALRVFRGVRFGDFAMRFRVHSIACIALAAALAGPPLQRAAGKSRPPSAHGKTIWNYDGGVYMVTDGGIPSGPCFRLNGRVTAHKFFDNLKRLDFDNAETVFRRGEEIVTQYPDEVLLEFFIHDMPCADQMEPSSISSGGRTYLTREQISKLRLNLYWKHGIALRPVDSVTAKYFSVQRRVPFAPVAARDPEAPEKLEWSYVYAVPSAGIPLTDSLVLIVRTPDDRIAARVAARM